MSNFLFNALLNQTKSTSSGPALSGSKIFIRAGIDTTMTLHLLDNTLECLDSGDAGRHDGIAGTDTFLEDNGFLYHIGDNRPNTYTNIWYFIDGSPFTNISRITNVTLLNPEELADDFYRSDIPVEYSAEEVEPYDVEGCMIVWNENGLSVIDNEGSSAVYELLIEFE